MLQGSAGVLQPRDGGVSAVALVDGFTAITLPGDRSSFTLISSQSVAIQVTRLLLRVNEICADGSALTVRIDFIAGGNLVSLGLT